MTDTALAHGPVVEKRRGEGLTAAALITPATIFVALGLLAPLAILFRYSLNQFVPGKKMMVEAVTVDELRQVLHRSLLHRDPADARCASPCW